MPLYTAYDNEVDKYFEDLLSISEYEKNPRLISPYTNKEYDIIFTGKFVGRVSDKAGGIPKQTLDISLNTPRTLGRLAEINSSKLGNSGIQEIEAKRREEIRQAKIRDYETKMQHSKGNIDMRAFDNAGKSEVPWRDTPYPDLTLNKMTPEEKVKFIEEGKKPIGLEKRNGS